MYWWNIFFCLFKDGEMEIGLGVHGEAGVRQDSSLFRQKKQSDKCQNVNVW